MSVDTVDHTPWYSVGHVCHSCLYCTLTSLSRDSPVKVAAVITLAVSCPESAMEPVSSSLANTTLVAMDTESPDTEM